MKPIYVALPATPPLNPHFEIGSSYPAPLNVKKIFPAYSTRRFSVYELGSNRFAVMPDGEWSDDPYQTDRFHFAVDICNTWEQTL